MLEPKHRQIEPLDLPSWNPAEPFIYNISKSYLQNAEEGPYFSGKLPELPPIPKEHWTDFLGFKVASPIGIPAGPLLNAKWIEFASAFGYDILCYKTIRSFEFPGHALPNVIYVETPGQLNPQNLPAQLIQRQDMPLDLDALAITNSFGMPSRSPDYLLQDIPLAQSKLKDGQIMIVSIVGTPPCAQQPEPLIDNFLETACLAKAGGAKILEANLSCPNVSGGEGCLYYQPDAVYAITKKLKQVIKSIPLILKVGLFPNIECMEQTLLAAARGGAQAISGINTLSMKVVDTQGKPALGPQRLTSGICGSPIRQAAVEFVQQARNIIDKHRLDLTLIGTGGIMQPQHFDEFFHAGAKVAMTATGMMWDPYLALRYKQWKTVRSLNS